MSFLSGPEIQVVLDPAYYRDAGFQLAGRLNAAAECLPHHLRYRALGRMGVRTLCGSGLALMRKRQSCCDSAC